MEQLLRGPEVSEVVQGDANAVVDLVCHSCGPVRFFPVRHHSPACSFQLQQVIQTLQPDSILIEGPENAQDLIPVLAHPDTKTPVALYYFYRDRRGLLSPAKEDYKCYYPFLDYSPELVALREGTTLGIPVRFIDLPYGEILLGTAEDRGIRQESEKQTYNDDYLLSRSRYLNLLCEKTGLRDFGELWEKYFEIGGLRCEPETFIRQMLVWCNLSRDHTPQEEMEADGCLLRERYMAMQIALACETCERVLVVTGGFHTSGLLQLLRWEEEPAESQDNRPQRRASGRMVFTGCPVKLHSLTPEEQGVYPLAYSMEATDALNGYASGMQSPGFYQQVWGQLTKAEGGSSPSRRRAYEAAVLHQLVSAGRQARRRKESISSADIISAFSMARGLAALRGKGEPGLYELRDGALSSFIKGERNLSTDLPLRILEDINRGNQVGSLCAGAVRPPILEDFEGQCRRFGLKVQVAVQQEVTLELFAKEKHMAASRFLHQMDFLKTEFAVRKKGADLLNRRDNSRVREVWNYGFSGKVLAALVDVSMAGATVSEAAKNRLTAEFAASASCREAARLMASGFLMGFLEEQSHMGVHVRQVMVNDGDFFSLTEGFSHLRMLYELQQLYQVEDAAELSDLLSICFQKIVQLLPSMASVAQEHQQSCIESCLSLYQITGKREFSHFRPTLLDAFERLLGKSDVQPGLEGAVLGLLYGCDGSYDERIQTTAAGYLQGTAEMQMKSAAFLRGLFYTARDLVFVRESFLTMVDELLGKLSAESFMELLPELRMAFGYFTPLETDRIAGKAAAIHGAQKQQLLRGRRVSPLEYQYGEQLDAWAQQRLEEQQPGTGGNHG